jgi:hypothetical protein
MERMAYEELSVICGEHIFKPERECIAVLVHYLGSSVEQDLLVSKMISCDFHLDAIEKVEALTSEEYTGFIQHILQTYLNSQNSDFVGQALLEDFKDQCRCCK